MLFLITVIVLLWIALRVRRSIVELEATVRDLKARVSAIEQIALNPDATAANVRLEPDTTAAPDTTTEARLEPEITTATEDTLPVIAAETSAFQPQTTGLATEMAAAEEAPVAPPVVPISQTAAPPPWREDSIETRIGSRWLLYVGVIAIVIGVSYFEKLAIDNQWIGEHARVLQGGVAGALLVYLGLRFARKGYPLYGQLLSGAGVAIMYVSAYAAFNFYHLVSQPFAFTVMFLITVFGAWLSDHERSQGLALMAVGGGFATPFLLATGTDAQIALFGYDAILIAGTMALAHRRDWPTLNIVSYGFTLLTVTGWATRFYSSPKYLTTEMFLTLYCGMYLYILREGRRRSSRSAQFATLVLFSAPVLYYIASLAILWRHSVALLVYLVGLTLAGVALGRTRTANIRLAVWIAAGYPLMLWILGHAGARWLIPGLAAVVGIYAIHLIAHLDATLGAGRQLTGSEIAALHLNGLTTYAAAYLLVDPVNSAATGALAFAFACWHGAWAVGIAKSQRDHALHFAALAFALLMIAISVQFSGAWVVIGWAAEGAAVIALGLSERRGWLRVGGAFLLLVAVDRLVGLLFAPPRVGQLVFINRRAMAAAFVIAMTYGLAWLHQRRAGSTTHRAEVGAALVAGKLLVLTLVSSEILAYWTLHDRLGYEALSQISAACVITGAVIMWLGLIRRQDWIRVIGGAVVALGALLVLSVQLAEAPPGYVVLWNSRAAAGVVTVAGFYALARVHAKVGQHLANLSTNLAVLLTVANLLTLSFLTSEINAFWGARGAPEMWSMAREGLQAIACAAVGSILVWIGLSRGQKWVRGIGFAVVAFAVLRLARLELADASASYVVLVNARVVASVIVIVVLYAIAYLYAQQPQPVDAAFRPGTTLLFIANALTLMLFTSEITAYWHVQDLGRGVASASLSTSHFAREMMLSVTWAAYATGLIVVGFRKRYAPIRYFAIAVFTVTIVKVFAIDLAELDQIYRVASIVGLGVMLLMTSYLYHRFRGRAVERADEA